MNIVATLMKGYVSTACLEQVQKTVIVELQHVATDAEVELAPTMEYVMPSTRLCIISSLERNG